MGVFFVKSMRLLGSVSMRRTIMLTELSMICLLKIVIKMYSNLVKSY